MEARFILPATIATALHALVLLVPREPAPPIKHEVFADPAQPPMLVNLDPPEEIAAATEPDSQPKGSPEVRRPPTTEEPTPSVVPDGAMLQKVPTVIKTVAIDADRILPGVPGTANGNEGDWTEVRILDRSMLDNEPRTRSQVSPLYPAELKRLGLTGEVLVEFVVDETGRVLNPRVVRSSDRGFEESTLRAVVRWRFEPGKKDGRPVRFRMAVPVMFSLEN